MKSRRSIFQALLAAVIATPLLLAAAPAEARDRCDRGYRYDRGHYYRDYHPNYRPRRHYPEYRGHYRPAPRRHYFYHPPRGCRPVRYGRHVYYYYGGNYYYPYRFNRRPVYVQVYRDRWGRPLTPPSHASIRFHFNF